MIRRVSGAFTGGIVGILVEGVIFWVLDLAGIMRLLQVTLKPNLSDTWLCQWMIWGGAWMLLLVLPLWEEKSFLRGFAFSLPPSAFLFFMIFPGMGKGMLGLGYGMLTPVVVIILNCIFGIVAALWFKMTVKLSLK